MNNRNEEITSWKPLTRWRRLGLKILKRLPTTVTAIFVIACASLALVMFTDGLKISLGTIGVWLKLSFIGEIATACILYAVAQILSGKTQHAKRLLDLEGKAVLYYLTPLPPSSDGHVFYRTHSVGPALIGDLRTRIEADFHEEGAVAAIIPLKAEQEGEIYVRFAEMSKNPNPDESSIWEPARRSGLHNYIRINMSGIRIEVIEAIWGKDCTCACACLTDRKTSSRMEMSVTEALQRIYDNRFRIESADLNFLWCVAENALAGAVQKISELTRSNGQLETDRNKLCRAIADAVTVLTDKAKFPRGGFGIASRTGHALTIDVTSVFQKLPEDDENRNIIKTAMLRMQGYAQKEHDGGAT